MVYFPIERGTRAFVELLWTERDNSGPRLIDGSDVQSDGYWLNYFRMIIFRVALKSPAVKV